MPLFDIFKNRKPEKKKPSFAKATKEKERKKEVKKPAEVKVEKKPSKRKKEVKPAIPLRPKRVSKVAYRALKEPHITEKSTYLAGKNQYIFKVWPKTNKIEVKKAIEDVFGVDVLGVKIINVPKKKRRLGRIEGFRKGYKKAIVRLKKGQKIEVLPR